MQNIDDLIHENSKQKEELEIAKGNLKFVVGSFVILFITLVILWNL